MRKVLKLISSLVAVVLMLTMVSASATEFSEVESMPDERSVDFSAIAKHLSYVEVVRDNYGMSDVDFNSITASSTVYAYEYTSSGAKKVLDFVPLMYDGELIAWVMVSTAGDEPLYQFTTSFVEEAREMLAEGKEIAFIYSYDACYLYDGSTLYLLNEIPDDESVESRKVISSVEQLSSCNVILSAPDVVYDLPDIVSVDGAVVPTESYQLNVSYVEQGKGTSICWAACIACVVNYLKNTSYTAVDVAILCKGSSDESVYNEGSNPSAMGKYLTEKYNISYNGSYDIPSCDCIIYNLSRNYPVIGNFGTSLTTTKHAVVIYGIGITETTVDYIYIMNPTSGYMVGSYNTSVGSYQYIKASSSVTYTLDGAVCWTWI